MPSPRDSLMEQLGYRPRSLAWAKVEIVLGLFCVALGLVLAIPADRNPVDGGVVTLTGISLFVLGGYLTLAGHRSHLYQSGNERLAAMVEEIRRTGTDTQVAPQRR